MNENIFNTLEAIDVVQESALDTQLDVLAACDNAYSKYCMFSESYNGDVDELGFFTEGAIGDEMKKMKGENESSIVSILVALPRFIAALIKVLTKKNEKADENFKKAEKEQGKLKKLVGTVVNAPNEETRKSLLEKIQSTLIKICGVTLCTTGIAGIVLHFKPSKTTDAAGNESKKTTTATGIELCITENGTIAMTKDTMDRYNDILDKLDKLTKVKNPDKETESLINSLKKEELNIEKIKAKYDGKNAKEMKLTGVRDIYNRANTMLFNLKGLADNAGAAAKEKAGDKKIAGALATAFDHVIRAAASFLQMIIYVFAGIGLAICSLVNAPFAAIKGFISKNSNEKVKENKKKEDEIVDKVTKTEDLNKALREDKEKALNEYKEKLAEKEEELKNAADDEKEKINKEIDELKDKIKDCEEALAVLTTESSVEEVPEGETVTQESATVEETETTEPVDPVVSSWYNK